MVNILRAGAIAVLLAAAGGGVGSVPVAAAQAAQTGIVVGRVIDAARGEGLPGALVRVDAGALSVATDRQGAFRLTGVPLGDHTLVVSYLGRTDGTQKVNVTAAPAPAIEIKLEQAYVYSEKVTVAGASIQEGQARALNQQRTALNITNIVSADQIGSFPDPNAAEAASRIPGVSIARDQGEGRYVLVRGTEARLNSTMIDGERVPAPESGARQVQFDAIPADQLQSIEVSKAVTPDMDADSIGGAVNLVTKQALAKASLLANVAGGYHGLQRSADQRYASGTFGGRLNDGRVGLLGGFSLSQQTRGSENFEVEYVGNTLGDLQLRDYAIKRDRYAFNGSADIRLTPNTSLVIRAILNRFEDYEVNNRIRYRPEQRRIEHVLKNRNQSDDIRAFSGTGNHVLGSGGFLDYRLAYAFGQEEQPDRVDTIFRQTGINFTPDISDPENIQPNPSADNPSAARLNVWETELFDTHDRDWTGSMNFRTPLGNAGTRFLKIGAKLKDKHKVNNFEIGEASPVGTVLFPALQDTSYDNSRFLDFFPANYTKFPGINADASRAMFHALPAGRYEVDPEGDAENYDASERVIAGYAMAELFASPKLTILPGVRVESTKTDYVGYRVLYDDSGDYASTTPVTGGKTYTHVLPGLHFRYAVSDATNLRAAYSRTIARPNYVDLVPFQLVMQEDGEIVRGNPALKPTSSDNLDLLIERYFKSIGVVSGGLFYKRMSDYVFTYRIQEQNFGELYEVTQPQNGNAATLWGLELAFQNQLRFLPEPFDGLGLYANYTWTDSNASYPDRALDSTLPGQSKHLGNFSLWYEKHGFSAKASWNFHGKYIDLVGGAPAEDVYYDDHTQFDVNVSQRLKKNFKVYADFMNLTNAPLRYFIGTTNRPIQQEYYRWWTQFGVKFNW